MALVLEDGKWRGVTASAEFRERARKIITKHFGVLLHVGPDLKQHIDCAAETKNELIEDIRGQKLRGYELHGDDALFDAAPELKEAFCVDWDVGKTQEFMEMMPLVSLTQLLST